MSPFTAALLYIGAPLALGGFIVLFCCSTFSDGHASAGYEDWDDIPIESRRKLAKVIRVTAEISVAIAIASALLWYVNYH